MSGLEDLFGCPYNEGHSESILCAWRRFLEANKVILDGKRPRRSYAGPSATSVRDRTEVFNLLIALGVYKAATLPGEKTSVGAQLEEEASRLGEQAARLRQMKQLL